MPTTERSLRITDLYAAQLLRLRERIVGLVTDRWALMDPGDLDASFRRWLATTVALVTMAQTEAVHLSDAYLAAYLSSELDTSVGPRGIDPDTYAGHTRDGRDLRRVFALALTSTKLALAQSNPLPAALAAGQARAVRATRTEVMEASRGALGDAMNAEERVTGYRRVVKGTCGACLALAGKVGEGGLEIHPSCRCVAEPIVDGVDELVMRPDGKAMFDGMTPAQQDRLFAGRGGAEKADLIRSGEASLDDLVSKKVGPEFGTQIYETPLEQLKAGSTTGEAAAETPAVSWKPSMTPAEAESWAADSAVDQEVFHATAGHNVESLLSEGFDLKRSAAFGRAWGDGAYLALDEASVSLYEGSVGTARLTARVRVRNPFTLTTSGDLRTIKHAVDSFAPKLQTRYAEILDEITVKNEAIYARTQAQVEAEKAAGAFPEPAPNDFIARGRNLPAERLKKLLQENPEYEGNAPSQAFTRLLRDEMGHDSIIVQGSLDQFVGGQQIVVFNPRNVTFVNG